MADSPSTSAPCGCIDVAGWTCQVPQRGTILFSPPRQRWVGVDYFLSPFRPGSPSSAAFALGGVEGRHAFSRRVVPPLKGALLLLDVVYPPLPQWANQFRPRG